MMTGKRTSRKEGMRKKGMSDSAVFWGFVKEGRQGKAMGT